MNNVSSPPKAFAASPGQRRLWFTHQLLEGESSAAYNMPVALRLEGALLA